MNYLPRKLSKLRKHYNFSQSYIADYLNVDVLTYMGFENGNDIINYSQMKKLANLYHIGVLDMFKNSDDVVLYDVKNANTDEINIEYFKKSNSTINKTKIFISNHKVATTIIAMLTLAIVVLSVILSNTNKPYVINKENINRLSVSETTVLYIDDSGSIGFSGSNSNGQMNDLAVNNAIKVCEGEGFSVVLNDDGTITSSGLTDGLKKEIESYKNIIDIAAGDNHIVVLDSNGKVACVGDDEACELSGTKNIKKVFATKKGTILLDNNGAITYCGNFIGSGSIRKLSYIKDVANSDNILAVLTNENKINVYSKIGTYLKSERWSDIVDVACGNDFVAGLDSYGKVHIEINNAEIEETVKGWSNIIAIDAASEYLIAFDGKSIYGVGKNAYNQFTKEKKDKITLEKVSDIAYRIEKDKVIVQFSGVSNASGYIVSIDVGTGLSYRLDDVDITTFSSENMIEGKTYSISITAIGEGNYKDSDVSSISFAYYKPEDEFEVLLSQFVGKPKEELDDYLAKLGLTNIKANTSNEDCQNDMTIVSIDFEDGNYTKSQLLDKTIEYTYCKVGN